MEKYRDRILADWEFRWRSRCTERLPVRLGIHRCRYGDRTLLPSVLAGWDGEAGGGQDFADHLFSQKMVLVTV